MSYQNDSETTSSGSGEGPNTEISATRALFNYENPQPNYRELIEAGGMARLPNGAVATFSRELTDVVLRDGVRFSSAKSPLSLGNVRPLIPLLVDPPDHSKYRKILDPLFTPRKMAAQEEDIANRVNVFIDAFIDDGECNFTDQFAEQFPSSVFLGLMGLPWEELDTMLRLRDGILHSERIDPEVLTDPTKRGEVHAKTGQEIYAYFNKWLDQREEQPEDDILTHFLNAEVDGDKLTREDILDICYLFLIAGLDTVSNSLTCFWAFLAQNQDYRQQIVDNPDVIDHAVEELLRWESPVPTGVPRVAIEDVVMPNGETIEAGCPVVVSYGAGNVDPAAVENPFEVDFERETNRHIAFGAGVHRCLGSHLARYELRIAMREWHRRIPEYRLKPGHEKLEYPPGLRHVKDLMLTWS